MGFRLGKYLSSGVVGQWRSIRFNDQAPPHMPRIVRQESRNIRPVFPATRHARVIAYWHDAEGRQLSHPALVSSKAGTWMTHVLLDDGDIESKKAMLLALLASHEPWLWRNAAARFLNPLSLGEESLNREALTARIRRAANQSKRHRRAVRLTHQSNRLYSEAQELFDEGRYFDTIRKCKAAHREGVSALLEKRPPDFHGR